jgi:hypothetical protein
MHFYPQGAMQSETEVIAAVGTTIYMVHGLGSSSSLNKETIKSGQMRVLETDWGARYVLADSKYEDKIFLGDRNIGKHHNDHYLFASEADATAYLEWALTHTEGIQREDWDY